MGGQPIQQLVHPELSYKIVGILFRAHNELPKGYQEKHVQRAVALFLAKEGLSFKEQAGVVIRVGEKIIGRYFLDFVVDKKIVVELKVGEKLFRKDFEQIKNYLQSTGLELGLLARFSDKGVKVYRVLQPIKRN
ncbi:hypothetical protein A3B21_04180 [Candidatus Uhrbacteria bacterium RIFCSPLOWO2_01_FULL_47_24]|uniref:GxxExxY protein n=1 Tax=Candidatus Uhrbacteria bacterium RIFCSPLOWO2_01_FULL_47_24 TaxID=1802401 RepID=A0A1F7UV39_9BACT|nr:MAG: hypothetical protein A2753_02495 [Candidatus Uhrbacteria bacterium RIFCSPHIGHO2_01_FULL_47_11]OGL68783.1 MAG: hypothetical protein A3D58_01385 [Candidatus Uhrbacteria bacterium RIFCSPHIGHO2_02_FULL_46_47]OGL75245.1 MAG: hypothetical protein A3F52_05065 [Candidatus Uhrbacteria bacterium RIFCSPHIGHO2_12_FULL_47_11]OGL81588.1 MAG: hypothetical protein A3B21_04180 [Candidatus Uhrbacteria bacterium RIFCSPLOWO2_01_FULL_47_24]OGL83970.1 MAG: hypothetical protein A3J03_00945 [Candidatus Uhrbact